MERTASKTVFRLRGLPEGLASFEEVASLVSRRLSGDISPKDIRVFSLATTLQFRESSMVATVMFNAVPSFLSQGSNEWPMPGCMEMGDSDDLILDTHFMGMTPLNDVGRNEHAFDCIAISGLGSHPFGSWQPKGSDKTFMWIRDGLPKHLKNTRAIVYGYESSIKDSKSFQTIPDLANGLIDQLQTYGWGLPFAKPIVFLAHSLGGLVLREALVKLSSEENQAYNSVLNLVKGALFFGVPNLGMEQAQVRAIVQDNPNETLVDDLGRNSNYLRQLNKAYHSSSLDDKLTCFWAYETSESPTIVKRADGTINRHGPPAILVSRESATRRLIETDQPSTFPINADHSDMIKFTKGSHHYDNVIYRLSAILSVPESKSLTSNMSQETHGLRHTSDPTSLSRATTLSEPQRTNLNADLSSFKKISGLSDVEEAALTATTFETVQKLLHGIQGTQAAQMGLMYMKRLDPFLESMKQVQLATESTQTFSDIPQLMGYVWKASSLPSALHSVLDAYLEIGEQIPVASDLQAILASNCHLREGLVLLFKDVLQFHREAIRQLNRPHWKQLFAASWRDFLREVQHIQQNIAQARRLIEHKASLADFEQIQNHRNSATDDFRRNKMVQGQHNRGTVLRWLSPFNNEIEQERLRGIRSICTDPGRWLLNDVRFERWFKPGTPASPLLWLSGIPGAGKTILASVVVDEARKIQDATVAMFYCKYGEDARTSFVGFSRSILAQVLVQNPHLLPYFHEKASMSNEVSLTSSSTAKEMMRTAFGNCESLYLIVDGLDECGRAERREITTWISEAVEDLVSDGLGFIRCLFVSQDDGAAWEDLQSVPSIKIGNENQDDVSDFAAAWDKRIERKFGKVRQSNCRISQIISARAQGMFIYAELFAKYLEDQLNLAKVLEALDPTNLPVDLDHVYERILDRVVESRKDHIVSHVRQILGWIVCAKRPLRWREIQAAVCIDLDTQKIDYVHETSESPKGLFASLVEVQVDGTVQLVHGTARDFLLRRRFVNSDEIDYTLTVLSLNYLTLPGIDLQQSDDEVKSELVDGAYAFCDNASACWAMHLQTTMSKLQAGEKLTLLQETLETFVESHWSSEHKALADTKRIQKAFVPMQSSDLVDNIVQAVAWANKQSGKHGQGPNADEALDLSRFTGRMRALFEDTVTSYLPASDKERLQHFYGKNHFKCPRVNCYRYYHGFVRAEERKLHINKHDRPFLCFVSGCSGENFGFTTANELKRHLFHYHGTDLFEEENDDDFPNPPKEKKAKIAGDATFQCHLCEKSFTRNHNLKAHLRNHKGEKPFSCPICAMPFTRKTDRDRHELGHGDKTLRCSGSLKDGGSWGCQATFSRADKLADHFRSKKGQKCILPLLQEKQKDGSAQSEAEDNIFAGQIGDNAGSLLAAGKALPSFKEFIRLCGLDEHQE